MNAARTVLGDVDTATLGRVDAHEHLMIAKGPLSGRDPDVRLDDVDDSIAEASAFRAAGGGTIVDALPAGCGRDPGALQVISREAGVHVIATTGFYRSTAYSESSWVHRCSVDEMATVVLAETVGGIDRHDLATPAVESTEVRPGALKVATGQDAIDPLELRMLKAVARVHRQTGLAILTHTERGTFGSGQLDLLEGEGVDPTRVMVGHLDRLPDLGMHRKIARRGAFLGYDGLAREKYRPFPVVAALIKQLIVEGFGGQLLLGGDVGRRSMRRSAGGLGIVGVLTSMVPDLIAAGITEEAIDDMLVANPARFLRVAEVVP